MPNCDWGKPCRCIDCRTKTFSIPCKACGFGTVVSYVRGVESSFTDRKGLSGYNFEERTDNSSEINCYKCGHHMAGVPYFEKIEHSRNESILKQKVCSDCGIREYDSFKIIQFGEWDDKVLCFDCLGRKLELELPDPSTKQEKFKLDVKLKNYVLEKVMIPCETCGKKRWVKAENRWKKQCSNCYRQALNH
ncbi:hypothetical protein AB1K84_15480 [Mesobacillus foraminis]|uniref:hypothetical protein n=1 Tax=Mesobacillus foraminis TaxID=279826 RepID=UPI0039A32122